MDQIIQILATILNFIASFVQILQTSPIEVGIVATDQMTTLKDLLGTEAAEVVAMDMAGVVLVMVEDVEGILEDTNNVVAQITGLTTIPTLRKDIKVGGLLILNSTVYKIGQYLSNPTLPSLSLITTISSKIWTSNFHLLIGFRGEILFNC